MIELVINADDLGLHPRIDEGIFVGHSSGVVTSSTVLVTGPTAASAIERAAKENLPLGLHLCLSTHLSPAAKTQRVRGVAPGGRFRRDWAELSLAWFSGLVPRDEVELEFRAQIARAQALGAKIDHLDTHQHLHLLPGLTGLVEALAAELGLPVRWPSERPTAHWLVHPRSALKSALLSGLAAVSPTGPAQRVRALGLFESGRMTERRLLRLIASLSEGASEIVCHPGLNPGVVMHDPGWRYDWEHELSALTSAAVRQALEARGAKLVSYGSLTGPSR